VIWEAHKLGVADALQPLHHERDGHRASKLTKREREVLRLMARGGKMEEIAKNLSISMATARWYSQRILNELGVHSRALPIDVAKARRNPCPGPSAGPGIASFNWAAVFQPRKLARRSDSSRPICAPSRTDCRKTLLYLAWFNPPSMGSSYMVDAGGG
jgi:DNA-binding CsgD family transcriptional regulator